MQCHRFSYNNYNAVAVFPYHSIKVKRLKIRFTIIFIFSTFNSLSYSISSILSISLISTSRRVERSQLDKSSRRIIFDDKLSILFRYNNTNKISFFHYGTSFQSKFRYYFFFISFEQFHFVIFRDKENKNYKIFNYSGKNRMLEEISF